MSKPRPKTRKIKKKSLKKINRARLPITLFAGSIILTLLLSIIFYPSKDHENSSSSTDVGVIKANQMFIPLTDYNSTEYLQTQTDAVFNDIKFDQLEDDIQIESLILSGGCSLPLYKAYQYFHSNYSPLKSNINSIALNSHLITPELVQTSISLILRYISLFKNLITKVEDMETNGTDFDKLIVYFNYAYIFNSINEFITVKKTFNSIITSLLSDKINTFNTNTVLNNILTYISSKYKITLNNLSEKVTVLKSNNVKEKQIKTKEGHCLKLNYNALNEYLNENLILIILLLFIFDEKGEVVDYDNLFLSRMNIIKEKDEMVYFELNESIKKYSKKLFNAITGEINNKNRNNQEKIDAELDNILLFCDKHIIDINLLNKGIV